MKKTKWKTLKYIFNQVVYFFLRLINKNKLGGFMKKVPFMR